MHQFPPRPVRPPSPGINDNLLTDRRGFLKTGLGGTLLLASVSLTAGLGGCATHPAGNVSTDVESPDRYYAFQFLTRDDIVLFEALLPAIVGPALSEDPVARRQAVSQTIEHIDAGIVQFGSANQKELRRLFDLLNFGLTRVTIARVWSSWSNASASETSAFLERWRTSSIGLFNNGYIALTKITNVAFYGHRDHWHVTGYPGPPQWAVGALPQFKGLA